VNEGALNPDGNCEAKGLQIPPIARPGDPLSDVDTPALVLDLTAFEDNLGAMQGLADRHGLALRPHAKAHRCPEISLRQLARGAIGVCCQKVSEIVPFLAAGIRDIHLSNEVVGRDKLDLLARLARHGSITVCVDHAQAAQALSSALVKHQASMGVLVEVDVGQNRCGVQAPEELVTLAQQLQALPQVHFAGIQAYHGGLQHTRGLDERRAAWKAAVALIRRHLDALARAGIACPVVTGGGTGSAILDVTSDVFTEIQAGTYAFMDADYGGIDWEAATKFQHSLFLLATVMSRPAPDRAVLDVGLKSTTAESGLPQVAGFPGVRCVSVNDEHSILEIENGAIAPELGAKIRLIPGHCDPTFNLHDYVVGIRNGYVEAVWPISARGMSR